MESSALIPAVYIDTHTSLHGSGGGVQMCNREAMATLGAAGFSLRTVPFDLDRRLTTRLAHRAHQSLRPRRMPPSLTRLADQAIAAHQARFVFFGSTRFAALLRHLRRQHPAVRQVAVSMGIEALDFCISEQIRRRLDAGNRPRHQASRLLGDDLLDEAEQRRYLDAVLALSPLEVEVERWLGARAVLWVPRTISEAPLLPARPLDGRVGCVSTLDHSPNYDGLVQLFNALAAIGAPGLRFRLVGQPPHIGQRLAAAYPFVDYVGPLDDATLRAEAATWCGFVHPLFVYAKGCSTKLAVGLGWRLPIATTSYGVRGYHWDEGALPVSRTPGELAQAVAERSRVAQMPQYQMQTAAIVAQTPSIAEVGGRIRQFLLGTPDVRHAAAPALTAVG